MKNIFILTLAALLTSCGAKQPITYIKTARPAPINHVTVPAASQTRIRVLGDIIQATNGLSRVKYDENGMQMAFAKTVTWVVEQPAVSDLPRGFFTSLEAALSSYPMISLDANISPLDRLTCAEIQRTRSDAASQNGCRHLLSNIIRVLPYGRDQARNCRHGAGYASHENRDADVSAEFCDIATSYAVRLSVLRPWFLLENRRIGQAEHRYEPGAGLDIGFVLENSTNSNGISIFISIAGSSFGSSARYSSTSIIKTNKDAAEIAAFYLIAQLYQAELTTRSAIKLLQRIINRELKISIADDGIFGPKTLQRWEQLKLTDDVCQPTEITLSEIRRGGVLNGSSPKYSARPFIDCLYSMYLSSKMAAANG